MDGFSPDPLALVLEIAPHLRAIRQPGDELFLIGEHERFVLRERLHARLVAAADGRRRVGDLVDLLAGDFAAPEVLLATYQLVERGYLTEAAHGVAGEVKAWWSAGGLAPGQATRALAEATIGIEVLGPAVPGLGTALEEAGLRVAAAGRYTLVVCSDYLSPRASRRFDDLWRAGTTFIPFKPFGRTFWLGPVFAPAEGRACWSCLCHRVARNRPVESYLTSIAPGQETTEPPSANLPATLRLAASLAALELARLAVAPATSPLLQHLLTFELNAQPEQHAITRRPQCSVCGDPQSLKRAIAAPVRLQATLRLPGTDGGHRTVTPQETLERCLPAVDRLTGVVAHARPFPGRDSPLCPVQAASYFLCPPPGEATATETFSRLALGKGRTRVQARASALAEAIERYASLWQGDEPTRRGPMAELDGQAIAPPVLLNFSARQYRERDPAGDPRHSAPLPFTEETAIDWTPCWSLSRGARRFLPTSYCFNQKAQSEAERVCPFDPNGHAAGNCLEEAVLQGLLELVERDAIGIWWYGRLARAEIDQDDLEDDFVAQMVAHYRSLGWAVWALDLTTDLGIPVIAAVAEHAASGRFAAGFGCHLDPHIALHRAITEAHQIFEPDPDRPALWTRADLEDSAYVRPSRDRPRRSLRELPRQAEDDLERAIHSCVERLGSHGLETIVLDYSRPDLPLRTVKVVVPGLRHMWRRLGPGRLYDVPVAMGDLPRPRREDELNPFTLRA
jgi:bacteriocin biosynthesis cyclodehydratase domain-containing protein